MSTKNTDFLLNNAPDENGRMVEQYLKFDDNDWEVQHDVIQMAFPTKTQSRFHPNQPFLPADFDIYAFSDEKAKYLQAILLMLLRSYMKSLGVNLSFDGIVVNITATSDNLLWASSRDHNTLRLTRVLECLGIFKMTQIQTTLHDFLVYDIAATNADRIDARTVAYWVAAKENKLHLVH